MATECDFELPPEFLASPTPETSPLAPKTSSDSPSSSGRVEPSATELEFLEAMQEYKRTSGRMFPTWSEVLEVARGLGYRKPEGR